MEHINGPNFLLLQALLLVIGVLYLRRRTPRQGLRLRFKRSETPKANLPGKATGVSQETSPVERRLNIHFNYNGHSWDAYEVLQIPAGSSLERAHTALSEAKKNSATESHTFLETAYEAIAKSAT